MNNFFKKRKKKIFLNKITRIFLSFLLQLFILKLYEGIKEIMQKYKHLQIKITDFLQWTSLYKKDNLDSEINPDYNNITQ